MTGLRWDRSVARSNDARPPRSPGRRWLWLAALLVAVVIVAGLGWWYLVRDDAPPDTGIPVDYAALIRGREADQGWIAIADDFSLTVSLFLARDPDNSSTANAFLSPDTRAVTYYVRYFQRTGESAEIIEGSITLKFDVGGKVAMQPPRDLLVGSGRPPARLKEGALTVLKVTFIVPSTAIARELVMAPPWTGPAEPVRYVFTRPK